jgi:UDPglucose--hexose-1-phosphate uridylyltransferase
MKMKMIDYNKPHIRYNPLKGEYVLVCSNRLKRPWQGGDEEKLEKSEVTYDKSCYMCPTNKRASGRVNPAYQNVYIFDNDYPALIPDSEENYMKFSHWREAKSVRGFCKVLCYSPLHNETMGKMEINNIKLVVDAWQEQMHELESLDFIKYVQIFENRGGVGNSNPHPHCQIWAVDFIPDDLIKETSGQKKYYRNNKSCLLCDVVKDERLERERIVFENENWLVLVPFWAIWPYETIVIPKSHINHLNNADDKSKFDLSETLKILISTYDTLFDVIMPLSFGIHYEPKGIIGMNKAWHLHIHFNPLLLRSKYVRKFMAGFEMFAVPQRDITPEDAAKKLKETIKNIT